MIKISGPGRTRFYPSTSALAHCVHSLVPAKKMWRQEAPAPCWISDSKRHGGQVRARSRCGGCARVRPPQRRNWAPAHRAHRAGVGYGSQASREGWAYRCDSPGRMPRSCYLVVGFAGRHRIASLPSPAGARYRNRLQRSPSHAQISLVGPPSPPPYSSIRPLAGSRTSFAPPRRGPSLESRDQAPPE